jgi:hypothetical protein
MELDVQVARSDWYEQAVEKLAIGRYLITPGLPANGAKTWQATLGHMNNALKALVQGNPPGVFGARWPAIDALQAIPLLSERLHLGSRPAATHRQR